MECIKDKRFLFWKWKTVEHDYELVGLSKFIFSSDTFYAYYECNDCGLTYERACVDQDELILMGISVEILDEVSTLYYALDKEQTKNVNK